MNQGKALRTLGAARDGAEPSRLADGNEGNVQAVRWVPAARLALPRCTRSCKRREAARAAAPRAPPRCGSDDCDFGAGERALGVDDKRLLRARPEPRGKSTGRGVRRLLTMERELAVLVELPESSHELAAEHHGEGAHRKEPAGRRAGPGSVGAQAAAGNDGVNVDVGAQGLAPCVEHHRQAELRLPLASAELQQRRRSGIEKQIITHRLILPDERMEGVWQRENDVEIRDRQQRVGLGLHPRVAVGTLAGGAMAIPTGMRHELGCATLLALVEVAAELWGAAGLDRLENPPMLRWQLMLTREVRQPDAQHLRHREGGRGERSARPGRHGVASGGSLEQRVDLNRLKQSLQFGDDLAADVEVTRRCGERRVAEQPLNHRQRHVRLQQVGRKGVAQ